MDESNLKKYQVLKTSNRATVQDEQESVTNRIRVNYNDVMLRKHLMGRPFLVETQSEERTPRTPLLKSRPQEMRPKSNIKQQNRTMHKFELGDTVVNFSIINPNSSMSKLGKYEIKGKNNRQKQSNFKVTTSQRSKPEIIKTKSVESMTKSAEKLK